MKHVGRTASARDRLKIEVNIRAGWSVHNFSRYPEMPSGSAAFLLFTQLRAVLASRGSFPLLGFVSQRKKRYEALLAMFGSVLRS